MKIRFTSFPGGKPKALTMSYDDGAVHDRRLIGIFNKNGIRGTFHLNSGRFDSGEGVVPSEIADLYKGHEVSVHTVTHPHLSSLPRESLIHEIMEDRKTLEALVGYPIRGMSYPFGTYGQTVVDMLPGLGMEYSRTVVSTGGFDLPDNFLLWPAACHHDSEFLMDLAQKFIELKDPLRMRLMYVWGHSFEFDRKNNWERIEEFCSRMGGRDDIWYATNIEIVDYINAVRNLRVSAAGDIAYNPSALGVWVSVEDQTVEIKPGETVKLAERL